MNENYNFQKKKNFFFLKIGIFFQNWEKNHLNSIAEHKKIPEFKLPYLTL